MRISTRVETKILTKHVTNISLLYFTGILKADVNRVHRTRYTTEGQPHVGGSRLPGGVVGWLLELLRKQLRQCLSLTVLFRLGVWLKY